MRIATNGISYEWNKEGTFKLKSRIRERIITKENPHELACARNNVNQAEPILRMNSEKEKIKEKLICYWSKRHYDREMHENRKFIEYLQSVLKNPDKLKDKPKKIGSKG